MSQQGVSQQGVSQQVGAAGEANSLRTASLHALEDVLARLDQKRNCYLELFASGLIETQKELTQHLDRVAQERHALENPRVAVHTGSRERTRRASAEDAASLKAEFLEVWPSDWAQLLDPKKQDFLTRLRAVISIRILFHPPAVPGKTNSPWFNSGWLTLTLELPALGYTEMGALHLAETDADLEEYWKWRASFLTRR